MTAADSIGQVPWKGGCRTGRIRWSGAKSGSEVSTEDRRRSMITPPPQTHTHFSIQSWLQIGQIKNRKKLSAPTCVGQVWVVCVCVYWFLLLTAFRNKMISIPGWGWRSQDTPSKRISSQLQTRCYWCCPDADNSDWMISGRRSSLFHSNANGPRVNGSSRKSLLDSLTVRQALSPLHPASSYKKNRTLTK